MRDIYHCSPLEFENIDIKQIELHKNIYKIERDEEVLEQRRAEQKKKIAN
jgi:predicted RNA-binding protein